MPSFGGLSILVSITAEYCLTVPANSITPKESTDIFLDYQVVDW